ncbi:hypothetical protein TNIN_444091 [Trichonephila inaurata madagascariensis]|uniref:Uncharacterized protein n=1 Tax=Trichonephila inaurata madagascariensis TaxID=2747483 RepID=A0A8X6XQF7_9ARAC|nr:hypothetical protein TNIN_444091 [Trichonephila inaurata madagascariensis]
MNKWSRYGTVINEVRIPSKTFCLLKNNAVIKLGAQDGLSAMFAFQLEPPFPTRDTEPIDIEPNTCFTLTDKNIIKMIYELVKKKEKDTEAKDMQNFKKSNSLEKHCLFEDKLSISGLHVNLSESKNSLPHPLCNEPEPIGINKSSYKSFDGRKLKKYLFNLKSKVNKNDSEYIKSAVMKSLNKSNNYSEPHPHGENESIIISPAKLIGILSILENHCDPNTSDISMNICNGKESESITFVTVDDEQDETSDPLPKLKSIDCHPGNENYPFTSSICSKSAVMKTTWNKSNNSEQYSENQEIRPINIYPSSDEIFNTGRPIYVISNRKRRSDSKISNVDKYSYGHEKVARADNFKEKNDTSDSSLCNLNSFNTDTLKTFKKVVKNTYLNKDPSHVPSTSKDHGENYSMSNLREKDIASKNFFHESRNNCELILDLSVKIPASNSICCNIYKDSSRVCPGSKRRHEASSFDGRSPGYDLSAISDEDEHIYGAKKCAIYEISSGDDVSCSSLSGSDILATVIQNPFEHNTQMAISDSNLSASTLPEFKSFDCNDLNKPSTSGTREECYESDNILMRSLDSKKKLPLNPFSSNNDSDSGSSSNIFSGRKRKYKAIFPDKSTFCNVKDNAENMLRCSMEVKIPNNAVPSSFSLRDFESFYLNDRNKPSTSVMAEPSLALDNILMSHVTTALQEEINSERQRFASFDEALIIDVPHSSISEMVGSRVIIQKKVSGDNVMLSLSIPKSFDYPQEILKRMLAQTLKNIYEMGILDGFKNHTVPHSEHSSNWFIDIPHRSNEGYEHELTSNISPCEKVSVTNTLATISGEQKDLINVAIYSSFSAIDSLKPEIRNKLIGGKKKIPNQNSQNFQFTFSELFDHPEENYKKKKCASECKSQVIGNVCELGNDTGGMTDGMGVSYKRKCAYAFSQSQTIVDLPNAPVKHV